MINTTCLIKTKYACDLPRWVEVAARPAMSYIT